MLCLFVLVLRLVSYVISLNARASCVIQFDHTSSFFLSDEKEKKVVKRVLDFFPRFLPIGIAGMFVSMWWPDAIVLVLV